MIPEKLNENSSFKNISEDFSTEREILSSSCEKVDNQFELGSNELNDEAPCCRVCHGESETGNELYHPCKCTGSIRYIHQACLVEWLKVSNKNEPKCELCGEKFHFENVYKDGAPQRLSIYEIFVELLPKAVDVLKGALYYFILTLLWIIVFPLYSSSFFNFCWCYLTDQSISFCTHITIKSFDGIESIGIMWYNGIVDISIIMAISIVGYDIIRNLYKVDFFFFSQYSN